MTISTATDSNSSGFTASGNDSIININTLTNALATANVTVSTGGAGSAGSQAGTITVAAPVAWNAPTTLTLAAASDININSAITATTGGLTLASGGNINVPAAVSIGGAFNLTSGNWVQNTAALPTFSAKDFQLTGGSFLRVTGGDGTSATPYTVTDVYGLQGIGSSSAYLASYWTLANDIDASGTTTWNGGSGFNPIGNINSAFTGNVDGLGHVISGLTINRPSVDNVGLFGFTGSSTISNIGLVGGSIIGGYDVGALVGRSDSLISNVYSTNSVMGSYTPVGGLVGLNYGTISHAYSTGAVSGSSMVGGLTGQNWGTISSSYSTGAVSGSGTVGGLVGANNVTITNTYATGAVSALHGGGGGLVGVNYSSGAIVGGYWDQTTTGQSTGVGYNFSGTAAGVTGIALADAFTQSTYAGFDFTNDWFIVAGATRPFLRSEWSTTVANSHQLQLMSMNLGAAYSLVANIDLASDLANRSSMWRTAPDFLFQSGFIPIGTNSGDFTGSFDGRGHTISNLAVITLGSAGLFRVTGSSALISNVGLVGGSISGGDQATSGGLVASNVGSIVNAYSSVAVKGGNVGGLVGVNAINGNNVGKITRSYSTGSVTGLNTGSYQGGSNPGDNGYAGGLVGMNQGIITESYATGTVTDASAAPVVGGFVGVNLGWITDAYAAGGVSSSGNGPAYVGGFVGINRGSELVNAYATGAPTAAGDQSHVGGFAGAPSGNEFNTFWDVTTSRTTIGDGVNFSGGTGFSGYIGLTSAQMADPFSFINAGWDFASVWGKSTSGANNGFMMLRSLSSGLYDDYVKIGGGTRIYGDANSTITGATLSGVGTGNVSLAWGSAIAGTTNAGTYNYSDPNIVSVTENGSRTAYVDYSGTLTISQRVLSLTGGRTYDGSTDVTAGNLTLDNLANGETLRLSGMGSMADKNAGSGKAITLGSLLLGDSIQGDGGLASNYTLVGGTDTVDIARAAISSIGGITANGKTYDGNAGATLNTAGATFNGMVVGDSLTLGTGFSGAFANANVGTSKTVSISGLSLSGADAGNYTLADATATTLADIGQRIVNLSGSRTYDGSANLDASIFNLGNLVTGETLTLSGTGAMADKNAGSGKAVTLGSFLLGDSIHGDGGLASNYTLSGGTDTVDIAKAMISSIGGITASDKTYDGNSNATLDASGVVFNGKIIGDTLTLDSGFSGLFSDANAGTGKTVDITGLSFGGADAGNYTLASSTATTLADIGQRIVNLSGSRVYNGSSDLAASIFTLSNLVDGETLTLSGTGSMGDKNAGVGKTVSLGSLSLGDGSGLASNYTLVGGTDRVFIDRASLSISGITALNKTYDGTTFTWLNTSGAVFNGKIVNDVLTFSAYGNFGDANVGTGKSLGFSNVQLGGADADNYWLISTNAAQADITPRPINLWGSRIYNGSSDLDASIFTLSNFASGETLTLSGMGSMADKNAGSGKAVSLGSLSLGNGSGLASNYTLVGGIDWVEITRAKISSIGGITANDKTYDGNANVTLNTGGAVFRGMLAGDALTVATSTGAFANANAGTGNLVLISDLSLGGVDAGNYTLRSTTASSHADIGQRVVNLSGSRTYDGSANLDASIFSLGNLVTGETLTLSGTGTMADKNAGSGKAVTLGSLLLGDSIHGDGGLASNYIFDGGTDTVDLAKAIISSIGGITADGKTYDGTTGVTLNSSGATLNGMVVGDSLTLGTGFSGAFSDKNAGIGKTVDITGLSLSGTDAGNYTLASSTATTLADIAKAYVFFGGISASSKVYDGTTAATVTISTVPVVSTDDMHVGYTSANFSDKNAGMSKAVAVDGLYITGADASNYQLGITNTTSYGTITPAIITSIGGITAGNKTYDGTTDAPLDTSGAVFNGMIQGDNLTVATALGAFSDKNAGAGKMVDISGLTLGGTDAYNYRLDRATASAFANIGQRAISLSGSRTYNGSVNLDASIFALSNLVSGETLALLGTGTMADKNAGSSKAVTLASLMLGDSINGDGGLASNYTLIGGADTVDIAKATISAISGITAGNKTYDGSANATLNTSGAGFIGMVGGDALTVATSIGTFSDKNAGAGKAVGISGLTLGGADAGNYDLADTMATTTADISQRVINLSGSRTYNGSADLAASIFTLSNLVSGETLTLSGTGTMVDKNAGSGKGVTLASLALGNSINGDDGLASNYTLVGGTDTVDVAKAVISSVGGIIAGNKTYDGATTVALNMSGVVFNGMVASDTLVLGNGVSGAFADANAGTGKTVTISGLGLSGADAGNYTLASNTATTMANIGQRILTLSGSRIYNGTTVLDNSIFSLSNLVGNETLTLSGTGSMGDKNAGSGKAVTLGSLALGNGGNGGLASNYTLGTGTVDIARATISSISGITANGKTYDGNAGATLNTGGAIFNGKVDGDSLGLGNGYSGLFSDANTGIGKTVAISGLSLSGADAGNYTLASSTETTLANIGQRVITLSGSRIYNGTTDLASTIFSLSNLVGNETLTLSGTGSMADKNAGSGKAVTLGSLALGNGGNGGLASNYSLGTGTVDIARATISSISGITANGKTYDGNTGATLDPSGATFNGIFGNDVLTASGGLAVFTDANAGTGKTVAISGLGLSGADAGNYTLADTTATTLANIGQRILTLSGSRIYNGTTVLDNSIFSLSNLVGNETLTLSGAGSMADKNVGSGKAVTLGLLALGNGGDGGLASNYTLGTGTVDIARATISSISGITANGKTYDGDTGATLDPSGATFNGIFGNDVLTVSGGLGVFADANAGTGKTVTISGLGLSGADADNYALASGTATTLADIARRAITVTANAASRAYGDANPALSYGIGGAGLVNGDTLSGDLATSAIGTSNVGLYGIRQGTLAASGNYALTFTGADLTVSKRAITVAASNATRIYGDANPLFGYTIGGAGLVNGDGLTGGLATSAVAASSVGSYGIGQGSLAASGNYDLTFVGGTLSVMPRAITVTANGANRTYGDADPVFTYVATGLVNGDTLAGDLSSAANRFSNVGSYTIGLGTLGNANYAISYTGARLTITPRLISAIANNASRAAGAANPLFSYTIAGGGLVNGDRLFGQLASAADRFSIPGSYAIDQGSLAASANYDLSFVRGVLTVTAAPSSPTADLASAIVPRSYAPDAAPPLPPVPADDYGTFSYTDEGRRVFLTDPRFAGTVVCLGDGTGCVMQAAP
ncbi:MULTISPECIES: YDG domain-containing protein [unclassified Rhizobium]|uniref:YDG domain-containing protein n=1 Tax=unclassified Rhizobium TaxID=2613769 RepID=UPI0038097296